MNFITIYFSLLSQIKKNCGSRGISFFFIKYIYIYIAYVYNFSFLIKQYFKEKINKHIHKIKCVLKLFFIFFARICTKQGLTFWMSVVLFVSMAKPK